MREAIIQIKNLTFELGDKLLFSLEGISISTGSRIFISGPTGCGKSSFAQWLAGLNNELYDVRAESLELYTETDKYDGIGSVQKLMAPMYVRQNPYKIFHPYFSIGHHFRDVLSNAKKGGLKNIDEVCESLSYLGIKRPAEFINRKVSEISQGEAQRCGVVLAMIRSTRLLILDEVTSNIDIPNSEKLLTFVLNFCSRRKIGLIIISHEKELLKKFDLEPYEITEEKKMVLSQKKSLETIMTAHGSRFDPQFLIKVIGLKISLPGRNEKDFLYFDTFFIVKNGVTGLSGVSGVGKTTLARALINEVPYNFGKLYWNDNEEIASANLFEENFNIRYLPQSVSTAFNPRMKIHSSLLEICRANKTPIELIDQFTREFGLNHNLLKKYPSELSGGEVQRMGVISMLIAKPDLIIFDESFSSIHTSLRSDIWKKVLSWQENSKSSILLISHDTNWLEAISDKVFYI